jgi:RNA polymerase sigma-70 factor (ECF subfamily)
MPPFSDTESLLDRAAQGDPGILADLFARHRDRLLRMVELRLDRRLQGRIDAADVLQDAYLEAAGGFPRYLEERAAPFYLWLRCITGRKLMRLHRHHLGARARDARREVALDAILPQATSEALAAQLLGCWTSPSEAAVRSERRARVEDALNAMDSIDREVIVLRHFEQLSNAETAAVLGIEEPAASKRHVRALARLKEALRELE